MGAYLRFFCVVLGLMVMACKSSKAIVVGETNAALSTKKIIQNHYAQEADFKTLSGRVKIEYSDGDAEQGVTVNYRMEKDNIIWMSAPLGVVKARITPEKVAFYNKLQGEYFEGDFSYLSNFIGLDIDFLQLQNLLLGNALSDLRTVKYRSETSNTAYTLKPKQTSTFLKRLFILEPQNFRIAEQHLAQPLEERMLNVNYKYQLVQNKVVPEKIGILASAKDAESSISLEFRGVELNKQLNFPYKVPRGYKKIELAK